MQIDGTTAIVTGAALDIAFANPGIFDDNLRHPCDVTSETSV
jgi:hypothetical protein